MYHTINQIFQHVDEYKTDSESYNIRVSFLEIYNETIKDLIMPSKKVLDIREDPIKGC